MLTNFQQYNSIQAYSSASNIWSIRKIYAGFAHSVGRKKPYVDIILQLLKHHCMVLQLSRIYFHLVPFWSERIRRNGFFQFSESESPKRKQPGEEQKTPWTRSFKTGIGERRLVLCWNSCFSFFIPLILTTLVYESISIVHSVHCFFLLFLCVLIVSIRYLAVHEMTRSTVFSLASEPAPNVG